MRFSLTTLTWTLVLFAAFLASAWSIFLSDTTPTVTPAHPVINHFDAYMEQVSATVLNRSGKPSLHIESPRMVHFPRNDTTRILKPVVTLYRKMSTPWTIHAEQGMAFHGIQKILFTQNVLVHHPADPLDPEMKLITESLTVLPDREKINTEEAVTLTQPDATIHAIGMDANFNTGIVHLLSDTRSEYVPAS